MKKPKKKNRSCSITIPPRDYQPSRSELREEHDMPGAKMSVLRRAFFNPVKILQRKK